MDWLFRQWNERSFFGWAAWWQRVALIAFGVLLLQSGLDEEGGIGWISIAVFLRTTCIIGAGWIALAFFTASTRTYTWRAALAGWSKTLPLVFLVPVIDVAMRWCAPAWIHGEWWFGPRDLLSWLFIGWANGGLLSLGLTVLTLALGMIMMMRLRSSGISPWKSAALGLVVPCAFWLTVAVPSLVAWTKLSTYGITFAPAERVVEQAFGRVWGKSLWYEGSDRFLDVRGTDASTGGRFILASFSWMLVFALLAPTLSRTRYPSLRHRIEQTGWVIAPVFGGSILGITRVAGQTLTASVSTALFIAAVLILLSRSVRRNSDDDEADERWITLALLLSGGFLLGWPSFLFLIGTLVCFYLAGEGSDWWLRAGYRGAAWGLLMLFGWAAVVRGSGTVWSPALLLGAFGMCKSLSLLCAYQSEAVEYREVRFLFKTVSPRTFERILLFGWLASVGLLWWGIGEAAFGGAALVLAILAPTALWLIPLKERRATIAIFLLPMLMGLLLRPGVFLP